MTGGQSDILIVYFSWTGTVESVAGELRERLAVLGEVTLAPIRPVRERSYRQWLWRTFLPGWRVPIRPAPTRLDRYDLVCLGFPKWTLACPPLNAYLRQMQALSGGQAKVHLACPPLNAYLRQMQAPPGTRVAPFLCFGGFDQDRYFENMLRRLDRRKLRVVARLALKRRHVQEGRCQAELDRFCSRIRASLQEEGT